MFTSDCLEGTDGTETDTEGEFDDDNWPFVRGASGDAPDLRTIFRLLMDQRRRMILRLFYKGSGDCADLSEIVNFIRRWEDDVGTPLPSDPETIEITLRHKHLPMLMDAGVIDFDEATETIRYRPSERLERFLDLAIHESMIP